MSTPQRTVRHLRLAAPSRDQALAMLPRLEDALRCASLPDHGARLLVLRRLALGHLRHDIEAGALARLIERRLQAAGVPWVAGDTPGAASADGVVFASALAARTALGRRLLHGEPATDWYWPLAVPEAPPALPPQARLRAMGQAVAHWPEAAVALPAWLAALVREGGAGVLAHLWSAGEGAALLRRAGLAAPAADADAGEDGDHGIERSASADPPRPATGAGAVPPSSGSRVPSWPAWLRGVLAAEPGGPAPARSRSAGAHAQPPAAARANPADSLDDGSLPGLSSHPAMAPAPRRARPPPPAAPDLDPSARRPAAPRPAQSPATPATPTLDTTAGGAHPPAQPEDEHAIGSAGPRSVAARATLGEPDGDATAAGGLLFLLPLLARLGLADWRAAQPDTPAFVAAVLGLVLQRLGVAADDPAWRLAGRRGTALLAGEPGPALSAGDRGTALLALPASVLPACRSAAPACWQDRRLAARGQPPGAMSQQLIDASTGEAQAGLWLQACRRWLRRIGGIGLASLVRRPGHLAVTTTHVDVHFRLDQTDLRVRRLGLDIDPQWLPWWGRVVAFHYRPGPR